MAMVRWLFAWACLWPVVSAEYNCSKAPVLGSVSGDFLRNLKQTCGVLQNNVYQKSDRNMELIETSPTTNFKVSVSAKCSLDIDATFCRQCLGILTVSLLQVCNESSWGEINLNTNCAIRYNAVDYMVPGWSIAAYSLAQNLRHSLVFLLALVFIMYLLFL